MNVPRLVLESRSGSCFVVKARRSLTPTTYSEQNREVLSHASDTPRPRHDEPQLVLESRSGSCFVVRARRFMTPATYSE
ncbi:hypothetical protein ACLB2K_068483 [Fragaria x ananassa]